MPTETTHEITHKQAEIAQQPQAGEIVADEGDSLRIAFRDVLPMLLGVFPFGMVTGAVATQAGLNPLEAMGLSVIVYAGASQLAALQLLAAGAPLWLVVVTAAVVNMRFLMYSAATAPLFKHLSWLRKTAYAYLLTDQGALFSLAHYRDGRPVGQGRYYMWAAFFLWFTWQLGTGAGVYLGATAPQGGLFSFVIPMVFLSMLIPGLTDPATVAATGVSTIVVVAAAGLPMNLGLLLASLAGIVAGVIVEGVWRK